MKLRTTNTLENHLDTLDSGQFSIAVNGKAFRTLIDGLYTHKVRAVIRELWTNAYDSHLEAGIGSVPFDVHLPGRLDPTFAVRDYGVSLSHEQIMGLYTTVFDSSKDDTNEFVGALGLGSKSPFAYTDSFTVIARLDGRKRTYLAAVGPDGTPTITLVGDEETEEAQGLEVRVAVDSKDFSEFETEAHELARGFDPTPSVDGVEIEPDKPSYVAKDGSFALFGGGGASYKESSLSVRQGCVIYPVSDHDVVSMIRNTVAYGREMVIDVPIGSVGVAASREALSLDDQTRDYLKKVTAAAIEQLKEEITEEVDNCKNMREAVEFWWGGNNSLASILRETPKFRGKQIPRYFALEGGRDWEVPQVKKANQRDTIKLISIDIGERDKTIIVIDRTDEKVKRKMMRYREFAKDSNRNSWNERVYLWRNPTARQLERVLTLTGLPAENIIPISQLDDPGPPERRSTKGEVKGVARVVSDWRYERVTTLEDSDDYFWIEVDRIRQGDCHDYLKVMRRAESIGIKSKALYTFSSAAIKRYSPDPARRLTAKIAEVVKRNADRWIEVLIDRGIERVYAAAGMSYERKHPGAKILAGARENLSMAQRAEIDNAVAAERSDLADRYPLLFEPGDPDAIEWYVKARDAEKKEKG